VKGNKEGWYKKSSKGGGKEGMRRAVRVEGRKV
jgi:hypothetical protein